MSLSERVIESTMEIFSSMVMMEVEVVGSVGSESPPLENSISGVVGLAGTHRGVLAIHLPFDVAMKITTAFLGMAVEEMNEDVEDAVGELANMLGGSIKAILSEKGRDIDLSLPTTILGRLYEFQPTKPAEKIVVPFGCDAGEFSVELQLER